MRSPLRLLPPAVALALIVSFTPARAAHWDLIYPDRFDLTLCQNGCGITLAGTGYLVLVNKGPVDISQAELFTASFAGQSSQAAVRFTPFLNDPGPPVGPIHPDEAVGSVSPYANDDVLLTPLLPGESFRNTYPWQVFAFQIDGSYVGPVQLNVTMTMGGESAEFVMIASVRSGDTSIQFTSAARTSSVPLPTPARPTTWGRIKAIYR